MPSPNGVARAVGKFIHVGDERFLVRGVTYGTFAPDVNGYPFPSPARVSADLNQMPRYGINTVRTYTVPDERLLDEAARQGLRVMVGIPWTQHVAFLDDRAMAAQIRREVSAQVRRLGAHPAVLMLALGNEIPAPIVRWHGEARTEQFLSALYQEAKAAAPEALLTYVNYPPTEYLDLSCFDVCAFNLYLHREADLRRYLARLQHVAGPRPLLLAEAGADSIREGENGQADLTATQLRASFSEGACGAIAFAWTDEWWRGGHPIEDWSFGLVDRQRQPKPALESVARVFAEAPFPEAERRTWPKVSIVVCAYNASDTIDACLSSLERLNYPEFDLIVINDGSSDGTSEIARAHVACRVFDTPNGGLAAARNVGLAEASGEIVAYTDADVRVDPEWLTYLVQPFLTSEVVGSGGPNQVPPEDPWVAQCVARAPGGPTHVLLDDRIAEHVPGCNMAFRREALAAIGGFNPIYLRAGDDVDVCWRLQQKGWRIGFAPSALVWHHHRASLGAYWKQQAGYGEGLQWLMPHHPDKFSGFDILWRGHIYSALPSLRLMSRRTINTGPWGTALFPSVYETHGFSVVYWPHSAVWQLVVVALVAAGVVVGWTSGWPMGLALILAGTCGLAATVTRCLQYAWASDVRACPNIRKYATATSHVIYRTLIAWLYFIQPLAMAYGRLRGIMSSQPGLVDAKRRANGRGLSWTHVRAAARLLVSRTMTKQYWSETWTNGEAILGQITYRLRRAPMTRALEVDDGWQTGRDVRVSVGPWAWLDLRVLVEEHGSGHYLVRVAQRLRPSIAAMTVGLALGVLLVSWLVAGPGTVGPVGAAAVGGIFALTLGAMVRRVAHAMASTEQVMAEIAAEGAMIRIPDDPGPKGAEAPAARSAIL